MPLMVSCAGSSESLQFGCPLICLPRTQASRAKVSIDGRSRSALRQVPVDSADPAQGLQPVSGTPPDRLLQGFPSPGCRAQDKPLALALLQAEVGQPQRLSKAYTLREACSRRGHRSLWMDVADLLGRRVQDHGWRDVHAPAPNIGFRRGQSLPTFRQPLSGFDTKFGELRPDVGTHWSAFGVRLEYGEAVSSAALPGKTVSSFERVSIVLAGIRALLPLRSLAIGLTPPDSRAKIYTSVAISAYSRGLARSGSGNCIPSTRGTQTWLKLRLKFRGCWVMHWAPPAPVGRHTCSCRTGRKFVARGRGRPRLMGKLELMFVDRVLRRKATGAAAPLPPGAFASRRKRRTATA